MINLKRSYYVWTLHINTDPGEIQTLLELTFVHIVQPRYNIAYRNLCQSLKTLTRVQLSYTAACTFRRTTQY